MDLFGRLIPAHDFQFGNSELMVTFVLEEGSANVVVNTDDVLEIIISDDLTGLIAMKGYVHYGVEDLT